MESLVQKGVIIEDNVFVNGDLKYLGRYVYIGKNTIMGACDSIGDYTSISAGVRIGLMAHPTDFISTSPVFYAPRRGWVNRELFQEDQGKRTVIGSDVLISANAMIRNGVTVGHGAIIGAGAFVDKDVPPYAIVVGSPAQIIRYRFEEHLIKRLLESEWWTLPEATIREAGNFHNPEMFLNAIGK
ncbi:MAG: CatB-related O-acetyltransferase [Bacteroidia bacterium]|nr:CatB-related O-acetyltransferase [Bacteroidia bacterium]